MTKIFCSAHGSWLLLLDDVWVPTGFNSKGAAQAAIPVERARRAKQAEKAVAQ